MKPMALAFITTTLIANATPPDDSHPKHKNTSRSEAPKHEKDPQRSANLERIKRLSGEKTQPRATQPPKPAPTNSPTKAETRSANLDRMKKLAGPE